MLNKTARKVFPPGEILADEIDAHGKKCKTCGHFEPYRQKQFSKDAGLSERAISEIINNKRKITFRTAKKIAKALGTSWEMWSNLQHEYDMSLIDKQHDTYL